MSLVVQITHPGLLGDLIAGLERGGCVADAVAPAACRVDQPVVASAEEARLELAFFVRAWQGRHPGVGAEIS
jgi:hypothetical protein